MSYPKRLIADNNENFAQLDPTGALVQVGEAEHKIHQGNHFFTAGHEEIDKTSFDVIGDVSVDCEAIHLVTYITATGEVEIEIYEGISYSSATELDTHNNNRNSDNTSEMSVHKDPDSVSDDTSGNLISDTYLGTDQTEPMNVLGGAAQHSNELILKPDTNYLIRITSEEQGNIIDYDMLWFQC